MIDINKSYTISEASKLVDYPNHVLRFYEKEFELDIPRNQSGHRYYTYIEIEKFLYIKTLKERGLSNKQIKAILNSPEEIVGIDEVAVTSYSVNTDMDKNIMKINNSNENPASNLIEIASLLQEKLDDNFNDLTKALIQEMQVTLADFKNEHINQDKDTLISENARLKMKLKEKSYETALLREKMKKLENRKGSFLKRLFGDSNKNV